MVVHTSDLRQAGEHATKGSGHTPSASSKHLAWSETETEWLLKQLEFFAQVLLDETNGNIRKEPVRHLLKSIQALIKKDVIQRDDPLLHSMTQLLEEMRVVDLDKLITMLQKNKEAGDRMEDRDVLLLCGAVGSGKTTTLHVLAGTSFEEVEIEGFFHLQPKKYKDSSVKHYKTSCFSTGATRSLQTAEIDLQGRRFVVCDTPACDIVPRCIEEEIANGLGGVLSICRSRSVRPILVIDRESVGHCFANLPKLFSVLTQQFQDGSKTSWAPLNYVFTRYDERHRARLNQQLAHFRKSIDNEEVVGMPVNSREFGLFVDDMIRKTTPEAMILLPTEDADNYMAEHLLKNKSVVLCPEHFFIPFASEVSLATLVLQLEITVHQISIALSRGDYDLVTTRLKDLTIMSDLLPDSATYVAIGQSVVLSHASLVVQSTKAYLDEKEYKLGIHRAQALNRLAEVAPKVRESREQIISVLSNIVLDVREETVQDNSLDQIMELSEVLLVFPEVTVGINEGLQVKLDRILLAAEEKKYGEIADHLLQLTMLARGFPNTEQYLLSAFNLYETMLVRTIIRQDLHEVIDQMLYLEKLLAYIPAAEELSKRAHGMIKSIVETKIKSGGHEEIITVMTDLKRLADGCPGAGECLHHGIATIWDKYGSAIEQRDYIEAMDHLKVIRNMAKISPEALKQSRFGIEVLGDRILKTIEQRDFDMAMKMMYYLTKLECDWPESLRSQCVAQGLYMMKKIAKKAVELKKYGIAVEVAHYLRQSKKRIPDAKQVADRIELCVKRDIASTLEHQQFTTVISTIGDLLTSQNAFPEATELAEFAQGLLQAAVQKAFNKDMDNPKTLALILQLARQKSIGSVVADCVQVGLNRLLGELDTLIKAKSYESSLDLWQQLCEMSDEVPRAKEYSKIAFVRLRLGLARCFQEAEFVTAAHTILRFKGLEHFVPEAGTCANESLHILGEAASSLIEQQNYEAAVKLNRMLIKLSQEMPDAMDYARQSVNAFNKALETSFERHDYVNVVNVLENAVSLSQMLPETKETIRLGQEFLTKALDLALGNHDYTTTLIVMRQLEKLSPVLPEVSVSKRRGMKSVVCHIVGLRRDLIEVNSKIFPVMAGERFRGIVSQVKQIIGKLMKSEPLREMCNELMEDEFDSLQTLSAEEFVAEQLLALTDLVVADFPDYDYNDLCIKHLNQTKHELLSIMDRLRCMSQNLRDYPGGVLVVAAYEGAFDDFHSLIDTVLATSEKNFGPTIPLHEFESHAWFLSDVITGFRKQGLDKGIDEHYVMVQLEARRINLMAECENYISKAKELLECFELPDIGSKTSALTSSFVQKLNLATVEVPRKLLLGLVQSPKLCDMLTKRVEPKEAQRFVDKFDTSLINFLARVVSFLENEYRELGRLREHGTELGQILKLSATLQADIKIAFDAASSVAKWSGPIESQCRPLLSRLDKLKTLTQHAAQDLRQSALKDLHSKEGDCSIFSGISLDRLLCNSVG